MKIAHIPFALALAGCAGNSLPPASPLPADIHAVAATVNAIRMPVEDYYVYGTALAAKNCTGWFGAQMQAASQNSMAASELGLLGTAAGVAGGPVGAGAAAAAGFGVATLGNIQANAFAGIDPVVTYGLVRRVQQTWLAGATPPTTKAEAYMLVEDFAEKCQLPEIKRAVADAITGAPVRLAVSSYGLAPNSLSRMQPMRVLPPTISVGGQ